MRTGQTFDYDFDMTARYQDGALAFVQTNTEKRIGAIEEVTIPLGRYEAYRVTTASTRRAADGLWTFSATTEYWRPDMGLLSAIETLVQTYDFVQEERTLAIYSMRQHTP